MPKMAWYVDTIDALAGRAFTSKRDTGVMDGFSLERFENSVFISPPYFSAEEISSASAAFGASRSSFQTGLFSHSDLEEIGFETLDEVCELVRRMYINGNAGNDNGGDTPPPPSDNDPDSGFDGASFDREAYINLNVELTGRQSQTIGLITNFCNELNDFKANMKSIVNDGDSSRRFEFFSIASTSIEPNHLTTGLFTDRLGFAATDLLLELFARRPINTYGEGWDNWTESIDCFGRIVDALGLSNWYELDPGGIRVGKRAANNILKLIGFDSPEDIYYLEKLASKIHSRSWMIIFRHYNYKSEAPFLLFSTFNWPGTVNSTQKDVYRSIRDLPRIPLPKYIGASLDFGPHVNNNPSLFNFLSISSSEPVSLLSDDNVIEAGRVNLLLLISAAIVIESASMLPPVRNYCMNTDFLLIELSSFHFNVLSDSLKWLRENLPSRVYGLEVEKIIAEPKHKVHLFLASDFGDNNTSTLSGA